MAIAIWVRHHKCNKTRLYFSGNHDNFRWHPFLSRVLQERVPGCVPVKAERKLERFGTQMERKRNANGTQMERRWNANGTQMERIYERVPDAFSVRLFLSSTVCYICHHLIVPSLKEKFAAHAVMWRPLVELNVELSVWWHL